MNIVNIKDIDLNNSFFHFTTRDSLEQINKEGLKAQIGDASKMKTEEKARVYMSKGGKGILGIKNTFIHEFKKLKICDIPFEYRKYFEIKDYSSEEIVQENDVYAAMEKRFKDEIYLKVNAISGEDFIPEDFLPEELTSKINSLNNIRDIKGKVDHDIVPDKLSIVTTDKGDSTFDILVYLYNRLMQNAKENGKEDSVKLALSDLDELFSYINQREKNNDLFRNVEEKVAKQLGYSVEEFKKRYDKQIITDNANKDGQHLIIVRNLKSKEVARYTSYTQDGEEVCHIDVAVSNVREANEAEIMYATEKKFRNKGNMTISLEEVLKDIFINKSFDGLQIRPIFPKTEIKKVFLDISRDHYPSLAVAKKSGFTKKGNYYEITEDEFKRKLSDKKQQKKFSEQEIGDITECIHIKKKDESKGVVARKVEERKQPKELNSHNYSES